MKYLIFVIWNFTFFCTYGQKDSSVVKTDSIYNYFTTEFESFVNYIGRIEIIPAGLAMQGSYCIQIKDSLKGKYLVRFNENILFDLPLQEGKVNGTGFCYYPTKGTVAIQAQFRDNKLNGLVIVQESNGTIIEIMKYKNGEYVKHLYDMYVSTKNGLKKISRNRSKNPLKGDEIIIN